MPNKITPDAAASPNSDARATMRAADAALDALEAAAVGLLDAARAKVRADEAHRAAHGERLHYPDDAEDAAPFVWQAAAAEALTWLAYAAVPDDFRLAARATDARIPAPTLPNGRRLPTAEGFGLFVEGLQTSPAAGLGCLWSVPVEPAAAGNLHALTRAAVGASHEAAAELAEGPFAELACLLWLAGDDHPAEIAGSAYTAE